MAHKQQKIDAKLVDQPLSGQGPQTVLTSDGLFGDLRKALAERMMDAEMEVHPGDEGERQAGNYRAPPDGSRSSTMDRGAKNIRPSLTPGGVIGNRSSGSSRSRRRCAKPFAAEDIFRATRRRLN